MTGFETGWSTDSHPDGGPMPSTSHPAPPTYNTAGVRGLLMAAYDDQELTIFCYDFFRRAHDQFTSRDDQAAEGAVASRRVRETGPYGDLAGTRERGVSSSVRRASRIGCATRTARHHPSSPTRRRSRSIWRTCRRPTARFPSCSSSRRAAGSRNTTPSWRPFSCRWRCRTPRPRRRMRQRAGTRPA